LLFSKRYNEFTNILFIGAKKMFTKNKSCNNVQAVLQKTANCDICGDKLHSLQGYLLPNHQVLDNPAYWKFYFEQVLNKQISLRNLDQRMVMTAFFHFASIDSPYIICEKCAGMFTFSHKQAKKAAEIWWQTGEPNTGYALCKRHASRFGLMDQIEPLDVPHLRKAYSAAMLALHPSNPELVEAIMVYHTTREFGLV
jgi:hypothetical protein